MGWNGATLMVNINCPQCKRAISADALEAESVSCPFCGYWWQRETPAAGGGTEPPEPLVEEVLFSFGESILRFAGSVLVMNTLLAAMTGGFCVCVCLVAVLAGKAPMGVVAPLSFRVSLIFWVYGSFLTIPAMLWATVFHRSRRFEMDGALLHVQVGRKRKTIDLREHPWRRCGTVPMDSFGSYFRRRPRYAVTFESMWYGFGFSEEAAEKWIERFRAIGIEEECRRNGLRFLSFSVVAALLGAAVGHMVEPWCALPPGKDGALAMIGCLDGFMIASACRARDVRRTFLANRFTCAAVMALACTSIGMLADARHILIANAILGAVAGWFIGIQKEKTLPAE